jgi:hypothetical protein
VLSDPLPLSVEKPLARRGPPSAPVEAYRRGRLLDHVSGGFSNQFLGVWHALKIERAQRDILLAAAQNSLGGPLRPQHASRGRLLTSSHARFGGVMRQTRR